MAGTWWLDEGDLDDDQKNVISLSSDGNHLVLGPPGSGKTNILLLRAKYLTLSDQQNLAIVVFTKTLSRFIASGGQEYSFTTDKIMTSNKWQRDVLFQYGVRLTIPSDFEEQRKYLTQELGNLVERKNLSEIFDAILLDEAQDYTPDEIAIFKRLSKQLFAVADSRQQIYKEEIQGKPLEAIKAAVDQVHNLRYHYRNGHAICKLADKIAKDSKDYEPLFPTSNYKEKEIPSQVTFFKGSLDAQCREIASILRTQMRVYKNDFFGVICPIREHVNQVWQRLQKEADIAPKLCKIDDDENAFAPDKPVCVSTVHGAKGLEMRAVHFAAAEHVKRIPHQRNIAFTAVTRAKTSLGIYHEDDLKGWFESAVEGMKPPKGSPSISSLFKGKK